jgi:hypothetical protein
MLLQFQELQAKNAQLELKLKVSTCAVGTCEAWSSKDPTLFAGKKMYVLIGNKDMIPTATFEC